MELSGGLSRAEEGYMQCLASIDLGLVVIILVAGVLGGSVNYCLSKQSGGNDERADDSVGPSCLSAVVIGIGAAFLVPLFLATISSSLIKNILDRAGGGSKSADILVFFGFCLIAAISSRLFIETLSARMLRELKQEVKQTKDDVQMDIDSHTEKDEPVRASDANTDMKKEVVEVLKALDKYGYTLRSKKGLASDTGLDEDTVTNHLDLLVQKGLASFWPRKARWARTTAGKKFLDARDNVAILAERPADIGSPA